MSREITYMLLFFMGLWVVWAIIEAALDRSIKKFLVHALLILSVWVLLHLTAGFPRPRESFGSSSGAAVAVMFACVLLGVGARYVFYRRGRYSLRSFLRPIVISPIVLLPLIGSVQGSSSIESLQLLSLGCLAFQNGFFWPMVLEDAKRQSR